MNEIMDTFKMTSDMTDSMKKELVRDLLQVLSDNVSKIILYGSVARGENTPESDIDIALFLNRPLTIKENDDIASVSSNFSLKYDCVLSIVRIDKKTFDQWKTTSSYYQNIQKDGITLWTTV